MNPPADKQAAAPPPVKIPWSVRDIIAIVGLAIGGNIAVFVILGAALSLGMVILPDIDPGSIMDSLLGTSLLLFLQWVITLGSTLAYLVAKGYRLSAAILGFRKTRPGRAVLWSLLVMFLFYLVGQTLYFWLIETLDPTFLPEQDISEEYGRNTIGYIVAIIQVALIVPVLEELFFRGVIHQALEQRLGFRGGAIISSAIFALAHIDPAVYVPIFILGFGFALLLHKTRSLWPAIAGHLVVNAVAVTAQFWGGGAAGF